MSIMKRRVPPIAAFKNAPQPAAIGDVWHRVDGDWIDDGSESYQGMELAWTTWRCTKVTRCGAWFQCVEWRGRKPRFALTSGAKNLSRTQREALERLIARKVRQMKILEGQKTAAADTLTVARSALSAMNGIRVAEVAHA
jgi:hypothetical protein